MQGRGASNYARGARGRHPCTRAWNAANGGGVGKNSGRGATLIGGASFRVVVPTRFLGL